MKFRSKPVEEHRDVPLADDGRWEDIVDYWSDRGAPRQPTDRTNNTGNNTRNACFVVSVSLRRSSAEDERLAEEGRLAEIVGLVEAAGDDVVGSEIHRLGRPDPRTLIRSGVAAQIAERARAAGADLIVLDAELRPSQMRNLEDATGISVADREAVILNVFGRHARSRRARMQVEIAHLEYLRPRIRGLGLEMDQQIGGVINGRGPGETASELLARRLDGRLEIARAALAKLARTARQQRKRRDSCQRIALVGYTNAGKTSLMNALTGAGLSAAARPFETLDATSRCLTRHGGEVLLSDTVGFIRALPERLFASFESTLAEVTEASLIALVVDLSDPEHELHLATSAEVLARVGASEIPRVYVFTKRDRLTAAVEPLELARLSKGCPHALISTRDETDVEEARAMLLSAARETQVTREVFVPYTATAAINLAYARCRVIETVSSERGLQLTVAGEAHIVETIARVAKRDRS